ncbi:hydroxymethylbilane synthase [bacterium]|nr:hydroxymethylbilane synthase [bacterium]
MSAQSARKLVRIGTRGSKLALWQANAAAEMVQRAFPAVEVEIVPISTKGDDDLSTPLADLGGAGVFVKQIEKELRAEAIDIAVHSAKDLPAKDSRGLMIAATPPRGVVNDVIVCREHLGFEDLPKGAVVGTSSPRRAAQLLRTRADLVIKDIRGNVDTRLRKVDEGDYDATLFAWIGLRRMGYAWRIDDVFPTHDMLPSPSQGVIALQVRKKDRELADALSTVSHRTTHARLRAERAYLAEMNAGCHLAVAGLSRHYGAEGMHMQGRVLSLDGVTMLEADRNISAKEQPEELGKRVARDLLDQGAGELLKEVK